MKRRHTHSMLVSLFLTILLIAVAVPMNAQSAIAGNTLTAKDSIRLSWMEYEYISDIDHFIADTHRKGRIDGSLDPDFEGPQENIYEMMFCLAEAGYADESTMELNGDTIYGSKFEENTEQWASKFVDLLNSHPQSMLYPFDLLVKRTKTVIHTSPDGAIRFYQWWASVDADDCGMKHVIQYKTSDGRIVAKRDFGDPTGKEAEFPTYRRLYDIFPLETSDGVVYLMTYEVGIPQDAFSENICAVAIKGDKLVYVPIFQVKKCVYCVETMSSYSEKDKWLVKYDKAQKTVTIRETDANGYLTGKLTTYKYDGKVFK